MHIVTFNSASAKKPPKPAPRLLSFEDAAALGDLPDPEATYTLDPDFENMGAPESFKVAPGILGTNGAAGLALSRTGWLDA